MERIELPYAFLHYEQPVVHIVFKDKVEIGYFEIRELTSCCERLSDHNPYYVLSDVRARVNVTPQGKRLSLDKSAAPLHMGTAILIDSGAMKIAVNFFGKVSKLPHPYKAFTDKEQALGWLKSVYETRSLKETSVLRKRA